MGPPHASPTSIRKVLLTPSIAFTFRQLHSLHYKIRHKALACTEKMRDLNWVLVIEDYCPIWAETVHPESVFTYSIRITF